MTAALDLLTRCRSLGIDLAAGPEGGLAWTAAAADPPAELLAALGEHKAAVLSLLTDASEPNPAWVLPPGTASAAIKGSCPGCPLCRSVAKGDQ